MTTGAPAMVVLPALIGIALLNRTLILSYMYPVKQFSAHASSIATVEVFSALFSSVLLSRKSIQKHSGNTRPNSVIAASVLLASTFVFSHALFSTTPPPVSIPISILSIVLAFIGPRSSCHANPKFMYPTVATLCVGVIGVISLYSRLQSFSDLFIMTSASVLPALLLHTTDIAALLSYRLLAIAFGVNSFLSAVVELQSEPAMVSILYSGFLLAINAAIATFAAHYLSTLNLTFYAAPFLLAAPLIPLLILGIPQDLLSVYPIHTVIYIALVVISSVIILGALVKETASSHAAPKNGPKDTDIIEDFEKDPMSSFTSGSLLKSIRHTPDYGYRDVLTKDILEETAEYNTTTEFDPLDYSNKECHGPNLAARQLSWKRLTVLVVIAGSVLASIISQYVYIPNIPGADPCSQTQFIQKQPQRSNGTHVLVTGGAGFIGSNLVELLLDLGYKVRVMDNLSTGSFANIVHLQDNPNFEFMVGDITLRHDVQKATVGIEYVYHLAAMSKVVPSLHDPAMSKYCMDTNAGGSFTVLDVSRNAKVKKVVYAASSTYYGNGGLSMHEDNRADLLTPYASSKYEGEIQMDIFDKIFKQPTISIRFFMVYGPRQPTTGAYAIVTGIFVKKMQDHVSLPIEGDGTHFRDFIHVRDIGISLILAQQSDLHGTVINSGTGTGHSVHEVADLVSSNQVHVAPRDHDLVGTLANTCRAKMLLGFEAKHDFVNEMSAMIEDAKNPERVTGKPEFQQLAQKLRASPWLLPTNSLVHLYLPHANDLIRAANATSETFASLHSKIHDDGRKLVVIPFSKESRELVENTFYSLVKFGQVRNILLIAARSNDIDECMSMNIACYNANGLLMLNVIWKLLDAGWIVHVAQPGTAYLRAVWPTVMGLLEATGAAMIVPNNKNQGSMLQHYTATPASTQLFSTLSTAKEDADVIDTVYRNGITLCETSSECKKVISSSKVPVTLFSAPYSCLLFGHGTFPTPSSLCSPRWEHSFYMDAACVSKTPIISLTQVQVWFMATGTCHKMADSCAGIPVNILHKSDPWTGHATCVGTAAKLKVVHSSNLSNSANDGRQSVLVIGGAGFIGSHLIRSLLDNPSNSAADSSYRVTVLDNLSSSGIATIAGLMHRNDTFLFVYGSVNDLALVLKTLESSQASIIVHLGLAQPKGCDEACAMKLFSGTKTLLDCVSQSYSSRKITKLPRIIFGSSSDVYGSPGTDRRVHGFGMTRDESSLVNPMTQYASGILYAEGMIKSRSKAMGLSSIILRLFPVYGPSAVPSPLDASQLRWNGDGIGVPQSSAFEYDWVHIADVVRAIMLSIYNPNQFTGTILNVGAGRSIELLSSGVVSNTADSPPKDSGWIADLDSVTKALGYKPKFSMEPLAVEPKAQDHPEFKPMVDALSSAPWLLPLGLFKNQMSELMNDLQKIAKYASQSTMKLSIIPYQIDYRLMAENCLHTLLHYGRTPNVMLFAMDHESAEECLWWNIPCFNATSLAVANFNHKNKYSDHKWAAISWVKPRLVSKLVDLGYSVHLSDSDIGYVREVWHSYETYMDEVGADMSMAYETAGPFIGNTGNILFRPTLQVKNFLDKYNAVGDLNATIPDQVAFGTVFKELGMQFCQSREDCDNMRAQGLAAIRDYSAFFGRFNWCPHEINVCKPDVMYIHPICKGTEQKQPVIEQYDGWYMAKEEVPYYCSLKAQTGSVRCPGVPSALLEGKTINQFKVLWCAGSMAKLTADEN